MSGVLNGLSQWKNKMLFECNTHVVWWEATVKLPLSQDASLARCAGVANLQEGQTLELLLLHSETALIHQVNFFSFYHYLSSLLSQVANRSRCEVKVASLQGAQHHRVRDIAGSESFRVKSDNLKRILLMHIWNHVSPSVIHVFIYLVRNSNIIGTQICFRKKGEITNCKLYWNNICNSIISNHKCLIVELNQFHVECVARGHFVSPFFQFNSVSNACMFFWNDNWSYSINNCNMGELFTGRRLLRIRCNPVPFDIQHSGNDSKVFRRKGIVWELHLQSSTRKQGRGKYTAYVTGQCLICFYWMTKAEISGHFFFYWKKKVFIFSYKKNL